MIIEKFQLQYSVYQEPEEYTNIETYGNHCSSPIVTKEATTIIELSLTSVTIGTPLTQVQYLYEPCNPIESYFLIWFSTFKEVVYTDWFN